MYNETEIVLEVLESLQYEIEDNENKVFEAFETVRS